MSNEKIDKFFKGEPIKYEIKRGKIQVELTLQYKMPCPWKRGIDHFFYADLNIEFLIGYSGCANRNPSLDWKPSYLHVDSNGPIHFDGLFEQMYDYAPYFSDMLSKSESRLSEHELRRVFDTLEEQFIGDFDNKEFREHFVSKNIIEDN